MVTKNNVRIQHNKVHHVYYGMFYYITIIYTTVKCDAESHTHLENAPENDNLLIKPKSNMHYRRL